VLDKEARAFDQLMDSPRVSSFWQARKAVGLSLGVGQHMLCASPRSLRTINLGSFAKDSPKLSDKFLQQSLRLSEIYLGVRIALCLRNNRV
jgi:hypothetical protein